MLKRQSHGLGVHRLTSYVSYAAIVSPRQENPPILPLSYDRTSVNCTCHTRTMEQNPTLVQLASSSQQDAAPLILTHDGGGTTFSYHCLPPLDRTVYAIHNPRFYSGRRWANGIPEMAKVYLELIRSVVPSGSLIVGGESCPFR